VKSSQELSENQIQPEMDEPDTNPASEEKEIALIYQGQRASAGLIVTEAIHKEGGITFLQLWHVGRGFKFRIGQAFFYVSEGSGRNFGIIRQISLDDMPGLKSVLNSLSNSLFCAAL